MDRKNRYWNIICAVAIVLVLAVSFLIAYCIQLKEDFDALQDFCEYQQSYIVDLEKECDSYKSAK
jgi:hypothetical protein